MASSGLIAIHFNPHSNLFSNQTQVGLMVLLMWLPLL